MSGRERTQVKTFFPPEGAYPFFYLTIDPDDPTAVGQVPSAAEIDEFETLLPALLSAFETETPGVHTSDTIDLIAVTSGSVVLDLGDGGERKLTAGDAVVQHGTRHRWRNNGPEPITMIGVPRELGPRCALSCREEDPAQRHRLLLTRRVATLTPRVYQTLSCGFLPPGAGRGWLPAWLPRLGFRGGGRGCGAPLAVLVVDRVSESCGGVGDGLVEDGQAEREFVFGGGQRRGDPEDAAHAG